MQTQNYKSTVMYSNTYSNFKMSVQSVSVSKQEAGSFLQTKHTL